MFHRFHLRKKQVSSHEISPEAKVEYKFIRSDKRSFINHICTLCDEPIAYKSGGEKVIELECGHMCHMDCLMLFVNSTALPICKYCKKFNNREKECIPKENCLKDTLISQYLVNNKMNSPVHETSHKSIDKHSNQKYTSSTSQNKEEYPIHLLRTFFSDWFINQSKEYTTITPWELDHNFGLLRLVDKFEISYYPFIKKKLAVCLLFENILAIVQVQRESIKCNEFSEIHAESIHLYHTENSRADLKYQKIDYINCQIRKADYTGNKLRISLSNTTLRMFEIETEKNGVLLNWLRGFHDKKQMFDAKYFTSNCLELPVMQIFENESTILGLFNSNRLIEMGSINSVHNSIILRRSFYLRNSMETDIMGTYNTITSSVLSIKKEKPSDILLLIQIDEQKITDQKDQIKQVIKNTLMALKLKYPEYFLVILSATGEVLLMDSIDRLNLDNQLLSGEEPKNPFRLEISSIRTHVYGTSILENLAIVAVSNSAMVETTSILFKNFSPLISKGRLRPNEIRIKVGYSNNDYSDVVSELVEIESWDYLLEALCHTFSLDYDDDYTSYETSYDINSLEADSVTTLEIESPFKYDHLYTNVGNHSSENI